MSTRTPPEHLVIVMSKAGAKSHVMDRRYAPLGRAICGASVNTSNRPTYGMESVGCKRCRGRASVIWVLSAAMGAAMVGVLPPLLDDGTTLRTRLRSCLCGWSATDDLTTKTKEAT